MKFIKKILRIFSKIYQDKNLLLAFIFFLSLLVSLLFLFFLKNIGPEQHAVPGEDYLKSYAPIADRILKGEGIPIKERIGNGQEHLGSYYPIGYPLILTVLFHISDFLDIERLDFITAFNILATALATCFLFLFVKEILGKRIALITSFLWLTYPFNLWLIKNPNTEVPFMLFLYFGLWLYILGIKKVSLKILLASGVLFGLASLTRSISVFLIIPLAILIFFFVRKTALQRKILFAFGLILAYFVVISPWIIYVYLNLGKIIPVSEGGPRSIYDGLVLMVDLPEEGKLSLPDNVVDLINRSRDKKIEESFGNATRFFLKELRNNPITVFKLVSIKIIRSWYATSVSWWERETLLVQLFYLIPTVAGIVVWLKKLKEKRTYLIFLLTIVFYFWVLTIIAHSILRYMIPIMGIVMIFASIIWCCFIDILIKKLKINY